MDYPSLIWANGIDENTAREASIPQNTATDLKLKWITDSKPEIRRFFNIVCNEGDIKRRQSLFDTCKNALVIEKLKEIRESVRSFKGALASYRTYADDENSNLSSGRMFEISSLFVCFVKEFTSLIDILSSLKGEEGVLYEIGEFYYRLSCDGRINGIKAKLDEIQNQKHGTMSVKVNGRYIGVAETEATMRSKFAYWFGKMGIFSELPSTKLNFRAEPQMIEAYAQLYIGYSTMVNEFYDMYKSIIFTNFEAHKLSSYSDELTFIIEVTSALNEYRHQGWTLSNISVCTEKKIEIKKLRDAALIGRGLDIDKIVPNDVEMYREKNGEKLAFWFLTGANGGGKTTYLRSVGSCVLMFLLGFPVCADGGEMFIPDNIFTHFPSDEEFETNGRFVDELNRVEEIKQNCTSDSVVLLNETFSGTDEQKSEEYSSSIAEELYKRGTFGLYVTHIHRLTEGEIPVLSVVIDETDENRRTYTIRRVKSTSSSFALDILKKYNLDEESLKTRIAEIKTSKKMTTKGEE